jgi:hypothetical protein
MAKEWVLEDNQTELRMKEDVFDEEWKEVKVIRETKIYYFMENGDQVYKSSGWQKCRKYPHLYANKN